MGEGYNYNRSKTLNLESWEKSNVVKDLRHADLGDVGRQG